MDVLDRMRTDRKALAKELEDLSRQKTEIEVQEREAKARLAELENALRVAERYAGEEVAPQPSALTLSLTQPSEKLEVGDALWRVFSEAGKAKVSEVVEKAQKRFGMTINPKTAGNYFWNWKQQGRARREGHVWEPIRAQ
jgi:hypothetical protein